MNSLKRFQLPEQVTRQQEELDSVEPKSISDVVNFNSAGVFYVLGKVTNMQYRVYKGLICRRKLSDDNMCEACGQKAIAPIHTVFVRLLLQDVEQADIAQRVTMFSSVAEEFLGMKAAELLAKEKEPESLAKHLDDLIAVKLIAKVNIKANSQTYTGFDWIVNLFKKCPGNDDSDVPKEKNDVDEIATKKAKKN
ncbi:hypothetical protein niasHT_012341 [Heterodera trifolii]|uniref:Replication factor A C-terminal domain-containing protein n=1 Tax=Heterodera trifolii TaxID=157864 RepID=A0ABD2L7M8_9BILA